MPEPIRLALGPCMIEIWPAARYLQTVFPDGTKVPAAPNFDPDSI